MRLISSNDILGYLSRWSVQQHPYHRPEGLFDLVQEVIAKCRADFKDGIDNLPMHWFGSYRDLLQWLRSAFEGNVTLKAWNTPRSGHTQQYVFSSRYDAPAPEDDFIDIDALWMNVARDVWDDAKEFEKDTNVESLSGT
jgi:hypothetical protein